MNLLYPDLMTFACFGRSIAVRNQVILATVLLCLACMASPSTSHAVNMLGAFGNDCM